MPENQLILASQLQANIKIIESSIGQLQANQQVLYVCKFGLLLLLLNHVYS